MNSSQITTSNIPCKTSLLLSFDIPADRFRRFLSGYNLEEAFG